jgi:hypothetical protein
LFDLIKDVCDRVHCVRISVMVVLHLRCEFSRRAGYDVRAALRVVLTGPPHFNDRRPTARPQKRKTQKHKTHYTLLHPYFTIHTKKSSAA